MGAVNQVAQLLGQGGQAVVRRYRTLRAAQRLNQYPRPYKLHIGCGENHFPGWIHLDQNRSLKHVDVWWDAHDGLPCADGTCQFIYSEHFLEHLSVTAGANFLKECHRALMPGGIVRIAMPDLHDCVSQYYERRWQDQPWLKQYGYDWIRTGAEYLNIAMRDWGHLWLYDREELHRRLGDAGFSEWTDCDWGVSEISDLRDRETRRESILVCEARKAPASPHDLGRTATLGAQ